MLPQLGSVHTTQRPRSMRNTDACTAFVSAAPGKYPIQRWCQYWIVRRTRGMGAFCAMLFVVWLQNSGSCSGSGSDSEGDEMMGVGQRIVSSGAGLSSRSIQAFHKVTRAPSVLRDSSYIQPTTYKCAHYVCMFAGGCKLVLLTFARHACILALPSSVVVYRRWSQAQCVQKVP